MKRAKSFRCLLPKAILKNYNELVNNHRNRKKVTFAIHRHISIIENQYQSSVFNGDFLNDNSLKQQNLDPAFQTA